MGDGQCGLREEEGRTTVYKCWARSSAGMLLYLSSRSCPDAGISPISSLYHATDLSGVVIVGVVSLAF